MKRKTSLIQTSFKMSAILTKKERKFIKRRDRELHETLTAMIMFQELNDVKKMCIPNCIFLRAYFHSNDFPESSLVPMIGCWKADDGTFKVVLHMKVRLICYDADTGKKVQMDYDPSVEWNTKQVRWCDKFADFEWGTTPTEMKKDALSRLIVFKEIADRINSSTDYIQIGIEFKDYLVRLTEFMAELRKLK